MSGKRIEINRIKIAGYQIKISLDEKILANENRIGEYSPFEQKISLSTGLTEQQLTETLIHEILEAINDIYELGLDHEEQLSVLSVVIHQILVDNPKLISDFFSYDQLKFSQL